MKRKRDSVGSDTQKGIRESKEGDDLKVHLHGTSYTDLPSHIIMSILLRLPIKSILTCKSVCKSWHNIISEPHFAQLHFECAPVDVLLRTNDFRCVSRTLHLLKFEFKSIEAQNLVSDNDCGHLCSCKDFPKPNCNNHMQLEVKFKLPLRDAKMVLDTMLEAKSGGRKKNFIACKPEDDKFNVVNSCNGLLCLCNSSDGNPLAVCNPITGEFARLPEAKKVKLRKWRDRFICGFGFLKKTNEYKVIRMYNIPIRSFDLMRYEDYTAVEVHTVGTGLWRNIEYNTHWLGLRFPTYFNGSLHWVVFNHRGVSILRFDLESETFNLFPCPSPVSLMNEKKTIETICLGESKGCLYISCPSTDCLTFWRMMSYGVGQSWTKFLSINTCNWGDYLPLGLYEARTCFLGPSILIYCPSKFYIYYDAQKHVSRFFEVHGTPFTKEPIFHTPSLIRLKDVLKGSSIEVLNVHSRCGTFKLREEKEVLFLVKSKADAENIDLN